MSHQSSEVTESDVSPQRRRVWVKAGLILGAIATLGVVGSAWIVWVLLHERLSPWLSSVLTESLGRPVDLGDVERVSLTGLKVGQSVLPPTETDASTVRVDSIAVRLNPFEVLRSQLSPTITLDGVQAYLEQDATGEWIELDLPEDEEDDEDDQGGFRFNPTIVIKESEVIVRPYRPAAVSPRSPLVVENINGTVALKELRDIPDFRDETAQLDAQELRLDVSAEPQQAGKLAVQGVVQIPDLDKDDRLPLLDSLMAQLMIQAQQLDLGKIADVALPTGLAVERVAGLLSGAVDVELMPLQDPRVTGTATLRAGAIAFPAIKTPFEGINAEAKFQGNRVAFDRLTANYGKLSAVAQGIIDPRRGYDLKGSIAPITLMDLAGTFNVEPPVTAEGVLRADAVTVTGSLTAPKIQGKVLSTTPLTIDKVAFSRITTDLTYVINQLEFANLEAVPAAGGRLTGGGKVSFGNPVALAVKLQGEGLPADAIAQPYGLPDTVRLGAIALDADISAPVSGLRGVVNWAAPEGTYPTRGTAEIADNVLRIRDAVVQVAGGMVTGSGVLAQGAWTADLATQGIQLGQFDNRLQNITASGTAQLAGTVSDLTPQGIRGTANITATTPEGSLNGLLSVNAGNWTADLTSGGLALDRLNPALVGVTAAGTAQLAGTVSDLTPQGIRGTAAVTAALRGGTLNSQLALANGNWNAAIQTQDFPVGQFTPGLPLGGVSGAAQFSGTLADLSLTGIQGEGSITAAIADGTLTGDLSLRNGLWQAIGRGEGLALNQLSPQLRGRGSAAFQLAGNVQDFSPTSIRGQAEVKLSDGVATAAGFNPALGRMVAPLTARLGWDGQQLQIVGLETAGLYASGVVTPQLTGAGAPSIAALDLNLSARNYDLSTLPVAIPPLLALKGGATFDGRLTGSQRSLNLDGTLTLNDLALNDLAFEPLLTGPIAFSTQQGLGVALRGQQQDKIIVNLSPDRQLNFQVQAQSAIATGRTQGDLLQATVQNFPISALNLSPTTVATYGPLRGTVTFATAAINLDTLDSRGTVNVTNLGYGYYSVDRLFTGFAYRNGTASFDNGLIQMVDRITPRGAPLVVRNYEFSGRFSPAGSPQLLATLSTQEGDVRDVLEILKIQELADFRRGFVPAAGFIPRSPEEAQAVLKTTPAGDPNGTLLSQLRRLSEILELQVQQERQEQQANLPPIEDLAGRFRGEVTLSATLPEDLMINFDLDGEAWRWGDAFSADAIVAQGSYHNGLVSLQPVQFSSQLEGEIASLRLAGEFSLDPEDNQNRKMVVDVVNVPVDQLRDLANLPFDLGGKVNGSATLRGRLANPDLEGQLKIMAGTLNGNPINNAIADFSYRNARADIRANLLLVESDDPISLAASFPFQPDFVETPAANQRFFLKANLRDDGFALLNLLTSQVSWVSGKGETRLDLEGDLGNGLQVDRFNGLILLQGATLALQALPEPMTNVTGRIRLVPQGLLISVDSLNGQFSAGELSAQGVFPVLLPLDSRVDGQATAAAPLAPSPSAPAERPSETPPDDAAGDIPALTPLTLTLRNIALNLKAQYTGQVNGEVVLRGSALLGPKLSGEIDLSEGTITLPEGNGATAAAIETETESSVIPIRFEDLRIVLGRRVNIVAGNLLNVEAQGGIRLDGTLADLRPTGIIRLPRGRVGLFAASLRLAGDNDRAEFRGGFDPLLDVTLQTSLPDTTSGSGIQPVTSPFPRNEVPDASTLSNVALTQQGNSLVRINARYVGPASELSNLTTDAQNLSLSSSPVRSQQEIISLLSGNVIGALQTLDNDNILEGVGTFLGSALLGTIRDFLGDTVPLSEFRIFQVAEGAGDVNDGDDLGGEIGFDITPSISVSVLKVLTNDSPFQFNARYRISDQFTLRGTTSFEDFNDRTGVLLEYETRF